MKQDIQIIMQLYNGHHLNPKELKRAKELVQNLSRELENRKN